MDDGRSVISGLTDIPTPRGSDDSLKENKQRGKNSHQVTSADFNSMKVLVSHLMSVWLHLSERCLSWIRPIQQRLLLDESKSQGLFWISVYSSTTIYNECSSHLRLLPEKLLNSWWMFLPVYLFLALMILVPKASSISIPSIVQRAAWHFILNPMPNSGVSKLDP